jgi:hypothetical protein
MIIKKLKKLKSERKLSNNKYLSLHRVNNFNSNSIGKENTQILICKLIANLLVHILLTLEIIKWHHQSMR